MNERAPSIASEILLDHAVDHPDIESWLVLGGEASLAVGLADHFPEATIQWVPFDVRERNDFATGPRSNVRVLDLSDSFDDWQGCLLPSVPDRGLNDCLALAAWGTGHPGNRIIIAGPKNEGVGPLLKLAKSLDPTPILTGSRSHHQFGVFSAGGGVPDDWVSRPRTVYISGGIPAHAERFEVAIGERTLRLVTRTGVFPGPKVDVGTRLLLDQLEPGVQGRVLDIGCGCGVLGFAAGMLGATAVTMVDANLLAISAISANLTFLGSGIPGYEGIPAEAYSVAASDVYHAVRGERFDLIVSNPPFHRGKQVDLTVANRLIDEAPAHLAPGASLLIVANAFLAYGKRMAKVFRKVETVTATRQFHVLRASDPR